MTANANHSIIHQSSAMQQVVALAQRYARSTATVLVTGETGTGKELVARHVHTSSPRHGQPYIRTNCAALSETLFESELFGHERGSFTGAVAARIGRFEAADTGTLLLDEVGEIPLSFQPKLLRIIEESEVERVGASRTINIDVRLIATTNRRLEHEVAADTFRSDLFHRLNVLRIHVPPLRERPDDIPLLVNHFINCFRREATVPLRGCTSSALRQLTDYDWPGNVRQLRNTLHRACVLAESPVLNTNDLPDPRELDVVGPSSVDFDHMKLEDIERHVILARISHNRGNKTAAAAALGVTARTLSNKLSRYRELGLINDHNSTSDCGPVTIQFRAAG